MTFLVILIPIAIYIAYRLSLHGTYRIAYDAQYKWYELWQVNWSGLDTLVATSATEEGIRRRLNEVLANPSRRIPL